MHALEVAPGLLIGLFAGVWVDRLRRRPLMIWADLGRALLLGSIPLAYVLGHLTLVQVYAVVLLISVLTLLFEVAYQSYLPDLVPSDALVAANSRLQASFSVAEISGFSLGGVLVQLLTAPLTVLFDALSFLASAVSLAFIRAPEMPPGEPEEQASTWRVSEWTFQLVGTLLGGVLGELVGLRGTLVVAALGKLMVPVWLYAASVHTAVPAEAAEQRA